MSSILFDLVLEAILQSFFNGGHPVVRHNTIMYKYLRLYTTILVTNATLFCSWRHVSAD